MMASLLILLMLQNGKATEPLGDAAFMKGDYEQALEYYYDAFDSPVVFIKRARVLSVLRSHGLVCEYDAYIGVILEYLWWAIEQDPAVLPSIVNDTLFNPVSQTVLFRTWQGYGLESDSSLAVLLPRVHWFNYVESITAVGGQMIFHDDGTVYVDWGAWYEYDEETEQSAVISSGTQTGHYTARDGILVIAWDDGGDTEYRLELRGSCGVLVDVDTGREALFDHPDECNT